jgi:hypothetical protein
MNRHDPSPEINWETADGGAWAAEDDAISRQYAGKWVVAVPGRVVAFGDDPRGFGEEAARLLGVDPTTVVVRAITHPDEWFSDYPPSDRLPAPQSAG